MPADIHFSEPHIHTGPWAVLLWCLLVGLATVGPALVAVDLRGERRIVALLHGLAELTRKPTGRHGRRGWSRDTGYVGRRFADTDAPTQVLCRVDGSWRA